MDDSSSRRTGLWMIEERGIGKLFLSICFEPTIGGAKK